jgi:hypothetical protein
MPNELPRIVIYNYTAINFLFEHQAVMCTIPKAKAITPAEDKSSLRSKRDPMKITLISNRICNANDFFGLNL